MTLPVPPPQHFTGHLLRRAQQAHLAAWAEHVSTTVSSVQFAALSVLARDPGRSQAALCAELGLDRATIADLVRRMETRGHVRRTPDPHDARRKVVALTDAGHEAVRMLLPRVESLEPILTGRLTASERARLRMLLERVVGAVTDEAAEVPGTKAGAQVGGPT